MAFAIGFDLEGRAKAARHLDLLAELLERGRRQQRRQLRIVEPGAAHRRDDALAGAALEQQQRVGEEIVGAEKVAPHADRPARRRHVEREPALDLVHELEGIAPLAVELIDEGDDRHVAEATHLEELQGLRLDALGRIDHHDRAVDGGERAVGVLAEILVAGRVEQVEGEAAMLEAHHRRAHGDAALALHLHPVRAHAPALAARLDLAGKLDRPAEQQQLLGEGGLAGVGVGDDGEGAPPRDLASKPGGELIHDAAL